MMRRGLITFIIVFCALFSAAAPAWAVESRNVAVSKVTQTSVVLVVKADVTADVTVEYGVSPGTYTQSQTSLAQERHEIALSGLAPSSPVYYRVTIVDSADPGSSVVLPEKSFRTSRLPGESYSFAVAGDNRPASNTVTQPAGWYTIVGQMAAENLDLTLNVGDIIYGMGSDTLSQNVARWDGYFAVTTQLTQTSPHYPALGNHERVNYANSRAGYEQELTLPVNNGGDAGTYGEHYYSFDNGDTHFVALSTEIPGQEGLIIGNQKAWLEQDLEATSATWIVVYMHRPLFSGVHPNDPWVNTGNATGQQNKADIHDLFVLRGVDVIFEGHDHYYLRHVEDGIQYIITGGGGAPLSGQPVLRDGDVFGASAFEHVKVDVTPANLHISAIDSGGSTLESFTIGAPTLSLAHLSTYWPSYGAYMERELAVDYSVTNNGAGDATNLQITYLAASNGATALTAAPVALGDLTLHQGRSFTIEYHVPEGMSAFRATTYMTCNDLGGTAYAFPGPAPSY